MPLACAFQIRGRQEPKNEAKIQNKSQFNRQLYILQINLSSFSRQFKIQEW